MILKSSKFKPATRLILVFILIFSASSASAVMPGKIRFHDEKTDTIKITEMLISVSEGNPSSPGARIEAFGRMLLGTPYVAHTLEARDGEPEMLTINMEELDCTTFVETVAALAKTVGEGRSSWYDFANNLESIRYRNGKVNGYGSRLHYIAEWILENSMRGNLKDATTLFPKVSYTSKSINFMTSHRDKYPALADSTEYERIRNTERGFHNHRFPYIKTMNLKEKDTKAAFRSGDIVALTSSLKDLDVTHMGIIVLQNGEPFLLHASSSLGKVVVTEVPLTDFMNRNRSLTGLRVFRLID